MPLAACFAKCDRGAINHLRIYLYERNDPNHRQPRPVVSDCATNVIASHWSSPVVLMTVAHYLAHMATLFVAVLGHLQPFQLDPIAPDLSEVILSLLH